MSVLQNPVQSSGKGCNSEAERRWSGRKSCGYPATISKPQAGVQLPCTIVDMSATGASLKLNDVDEAQPNQGVLLPAYFTLVSRIDRMEYDCAVVWRHQAHLGVKFLSPARMI